MRLSLPSKEHYFPVDDLQNAAIIREVHVYGQSVELGEDGSGSVQHRGLGTKLIEKAAEIAASFGYEKLSVISAVEPASITQAEVLSKGAVYGARFGIELRRAS